MRHRVLYVIDNMEFGGGERAFSQLITRLPGDSYRIAVACLPGGLFEEKIKGSGAEIFPVDMRNRYNPMGIWRLAGLMRREKVEIVHSQGGRADFLARMAARLAGVPFVVSTIAMPVEGYDVSPLRSSMYVALDRLSERFVNKFIVVSQALEQVLVRTHGVKPDKVVVIPNGIEIEEYEPNHKAFSTQHSAVRKEIGVNPDVPLIGAIGRLVWQKGFEYLIEAIPQIKEKFPLANFLIVGEGPLRERLKTKAQRLNVKASIIFAGFRNNIKEILESIDVLALPSLLEGLPMVLLEGMAMAKPIVATRIDGITEVLVDGKTGWLIPPEDPFRLAEGIIHLLSNMDRARQMGLAARRDAEERFSVEIIVKRVNELYQELLANS